MTIKKNNNKNFEWPLTPNKEIEIRKNLFVSFDGPTIIIHLNKPFQDHDVRLPHPSLPSVSSSLATNVEEKRIIRKKDNI